MDTRLLGKSNEGIEEEYPAGLDTGHYRSVPFCPPSVVELAEPHGRRALVRVERARGHAETRVCTSLCVLVSRYLVTNSRLLWLGFIGQRYSCFGTVEFWWPGGTSY